MEKPLISIIIPTLNAGKTIKKCLDSVLQQTLKDFEVIIQDSNSIDDTINIVNVFGDARIKVIVEADDGVYDAMNKAVIKSTGLWIYYLGADDYFIKIDVLENFRKILLQDNYDFIYGNVTSQELGATYDGVFDLEKLKIKNICHQAIIVRRQVIDTIGNFKDKYTSWADWDFNIRCFIHPKVRIAYIPITVAFFNTGGISSTKPDRNFLLDIHLNIQQYQKMYRPIYFRIKCLTNPFYRFVTKLKSLLIIKTKH